jgi:HK97 family phage portal protein
MSIRDIANDTAKLRAKSANSAPSRLYGAMIWGNGVWSQSRWNRQQLITQAYERNPAFYAAVNIIARTLASIPIYIEYKHLGQSKTTSHHPLLAALERNSPREEYMDRFTKYLLTTGDAYANIVFGTSTGIKQPLGLIVMPSQHTYNIEGDWRRPIRGYRYVENREEYFDEEEVIHVYQPSLSNYFEGMSPAVPLQEYIDLNNAAITWNKNVALSGGIPPIVARADGINKEEGERLRQSWREQNGAMNAGDLKLISENMTLEKMNMTPHDAEWEKAVLQAMRVIFMTLGVSSSIMNDAANKTYNNVHDSRKALYQEGVIPLARLIYSAHSRKLGRYFRDEPKIIIDVDNIDGIQEDKRMQAQRLTELKREGIITANEARIELRYPISPDDVANKLVNSSVANNIPKAARPQDEQPTSTPPDPTL